MYSTWEFWRFCTEKQSLDKFLHFSWLSLDLALLVFLSIHDDLAASGQGNSSHDSLVIFAKKSLQGVFLFDTWGLDAHRK